MLSSLAQRCLGTANPPLTYFSRSVFLPQAITSQRSVMHSLPGNYFVFDKIDTFEGNNFRT